MSQLPWANKNLGQHFLKDKNVISKISNDFREEADVILEVGPGPAILSKTLKEHALPYHVIEMDQRFKEYLIPHVKEECMHFEDALSFDINSFIINQGLSDKKIWLVSNLPYNISVPLTLKFIQCPQIKMMSLMYQREVADKIFNFDTRKGKAMNSLMALCQNYFSVNLCCKVPPEAFTPAPKVESAVLSFKRRTSTLIPLDQFSKFERFLRLSFQFKRKQLGKILKSQYPIEKIDDALKKIDSDRTVRAESFNLNQIQLLYIELNPFSD